MVHAPTVRSVAMRGLSKAIPVTPSRNAHGRDHKPDEAVIDAAFSPGNRGVPGDASHGTGLCGPP
jgi:hypothetical protein